MQTDKRSCNDYDIGSLFFCSLFPFPPLPQKNPTVSEHRSFTASSSLTTIFGDCLVSELHPCDTRSLSLVQVSPLQRRFYRQTVLVVK